MTIDEFAAISRRVIDRDGLMEFLPTACLPVRKVIRVLEAVPPGADIEATALHWAFGQAAPNEEVLVAFRIDSRHFKIVRREGAETKHAVFAVDKA